MRFLFAAFAASLAIQALVLPPQGSVGFSIAKSDLWVEALHWRCHGAPAPHLASEIAIPPIVSRLVCSALDTYAGLLCAAAVGVTSLMLLAVASHDAPPWLVGLIVCNPLSHLLPAVRSSSAVQQLLFAAVLVPTASRRCWAGVPLMATACAVAMLGWPSYAALVAVELDALARTRLRMGPAGRAVFMAVVTVLFAARLWHAGQPHDGVALASASVLPNTGSRWYLEQQLMHFARSGYAHALSMYPVVVAQLVCLRLGVTCDAWLPALPQVVALAVCYLLSHENTVSDTVFLALAATVVVPSVADRAFSGFFPRAVLLVALPLMQAFHIGWVQYDVANVNWLFFTCVAYTAACSLCVVEGARFALTHQAKLKEE